MDSVFNLTKKAQPGTEPDSDHPINPKTSTNDPDLLSSAKVVAGAAQSQFRSEEYDREKSAGAGADLLNAASDYGKLDTNQGVGKYVDQAEGYLRQYNTNSTAGTKTSESDESATAADESGGLKSTLTTDDAVKATITDHSAADGGDSAEDVIKSAFPTGDADKASGGGTEEYVKKAEGFLSKESGDGGEEEKTGDYDSLKEKAEGFLSKGSGDGGEEEKTGDYASLKEKAEGFLSKKSGDEEKTGDYDSLKEEAEGALKKLQPGDAAGEYMKEADAEYGGEKTEAESETQSGGGFGNVMKMAGGFLKK